MVVAVQFAAGEGGGSEGDGEGDEGEGASTSPSHEPGAYPGQHGAQPLQPFQVHLPSPSHVCVLLGQKPAHWPQW